MHDFPDRRFYACCAFDLIKFTSRYLLAIVWQTVCNVIFMCDE